MEQWVEHHQALINGIFFVLAVLGLFSDSTRRIAQSIPKGLKAVRHTYRVLLRDRLTEYLCSPEILIEASLYTSGYSILATVLGGYCDLHAFYSYAAAKHVWNGNPEFQIALLVMYARVFMRVLLFFGLSVTLMFWMYRKPAHRLKKVTELLQKESTTSYVPRDSLSL